MLADKPICIDPPGWEVLEAACREAQRRGLLVCDIMTQRHEITSIIARELVNTPGVFGTLQQGTPEAPAVVKESVHHLYKHVSGQALIRPAWYFDVTQQGEGIVDVTTHLIDNTLWECFPDEAIDHTDVRMLHARRWPTRVDRAQFAQVTGLSEFPAFLHGALDAQGALPYFCNGEFTCAIRGVHARMWVAWDFAAPPGGDDTHVSVTRGTRSEVFIRQGEAQGYRPEVYVEPSAGTGRADLGASLDQALADLAPRYPGLTTSPAGEGWQVHIPDVYRIGHEAHFGKVMEGYLDGLERGALPAWEIPNLLTKYHMTTTALAMAKTGKT